MSQFQQVETINILAITHHKQCIIAHIQKYSTPSQKHTTKSSLQESNQNKHNTITKNHQTRNLTKTHNIHNQKSSISRGLSTSIDIHNK